MNETQVFEARWWTPLSMQTDFITSLRQWRLNVEQCS